MLINQFVTGYRNVSRIPRGSPLPSTFCAPSMIRFVASHGTLFESCKRIHQLLSCHRFAPFYSLRSIDSTAVSFNFLRSSVDFPSGIVPPHTALSLPRSRYRSYKKVEGFSFRLDVPRFQSVASLFPSASFVPFDSFFSIYLFVYLVNERKFPLKYK